MDKRLRVTRVLVFEGPEEWIEHTLAMSWLQPEKSGQVRFLAHDKNAIEVSRVIEEIG
jgi:hypothetical protein